MKGSTLGAVVAGALLVGVAAPAALATPGNGNGNAHGRGPCRERQVEGGEWPGMSGDLAGSRFQPGELGITPANAGSLEPAWAVQVSAGGLSANLNSTPTVAGGCVFVGTAAGDIVAFDADTGDIIWSVDYGVDVAGLGDDIVSAVVVDGNRAITLINELEGPFAVALDVRDGSEVWRSAPFDTEAGSYTNASPVVVPSEGGDVVVAGWSPPEGDGLGQGGFVVLDAETGALLQKTYTIPEADQQDLDGDGFDDYAGGGIWAPISYDESSGFGYVGAGNTFSKTTEHERTNAILKIDLGDRSSPTFGDIVDEFKGVPDQYDEGLVALRTTPACDLSELNTTWPLDDPVCGQLDLDFGAPVNVYEIGGQTIVAGLQKAGIVHAFDADTGAEVWTATVGAPCAACNAAATAIGPTGLAGVGTPGGLAFSLDPLTGALQWTSPIGDGAHYNGVSLAGGVYYTLDNAGTLSVLDAADGTILTRRPMAADTGVPMAAFSSSGISIANHTVYVAANGVNAAATGPADGLAGWVIAYRPA